MNIIFDLNFVVQLSLFRIFRIESSCICMCIRIRGHSFLISPQEDPNSSYELPRGLIRDNNVFLKLQSFYSLCFSLFFSGREKVKCGVVDEVGIFVSYRVKSPHF